MKITSDSVLSFSVSSNKLQNVKYVLSGIFYLISLQFSLRTNNNFIPVLGHTFSAHLPHATPAELLIILNISVRAASVDM